MKLLHKDFAKGGEGSVKLVAEEGELLLEMGRACTLQRLMAGNFEWRVRHPGLKHKLQARCLSYLW